MRLRVVKQGAGLIVLGTDQVAVAREALPGDVTGWDHSEPGLYARRQGRWRACPEPPYAPKDARPAVQFIAVRRSRLQRDLGRDTGVTTQSDYVRTDELDDALIPLDVAATVFKVSERTIRRWIDADQITRHPYAGGKAIRWGDIPAPSTNTTRWKRP